jgi:maleate isomerase
MPRPTLAPNGVIGVLVPWGNTTTELEIAPLTPPGVINAVARFNFGPGIDVEAELRDVAGKLAYAEPSAMLLSLSPEMFEGGIGRARAYQKLIAEASGLAAFTTTDGTFHELRRVGASSVGLIAPAPQERMGHAVANFAAEGITVVRAHGMNCGLPNIKSTPLDDIAAAFRAVDDTGVEAFVQVGTGLPAFAVAEQIEAEMGRPVITSSAAGYRHTLEALGIAPAG